MSAPSPASSRCASPRPPRRARGAAIVLALLTTFILAGFASGMLAAYGGAVEVLAGRHDQAQARRLARSAVDWGRNVLADDARNGVDHRGEPWALKLPPTPVEDGEVGGELSDLSGRFDLNSLAPAGKPDRDAVAAFGRLLAAVGEDPSGVERITAAVIARLLPQEAGERRSGPFVHADELLGLAGVPTPLFERLAPHVAALPSPSRLNVNTASPEVLHAMIPGLPLDSARVLAAHRDRAWFRTLQEFSARLPQSAAVPSGERFGVSTRYFLATGRARYGMATTQMEVLLDRRQVWPDILWQRML